VKYEQFLEIYQAGPEAVFQLVSQLSAMNSALRQRVALQKEIIVQHEEKLARQHENIKLLEDQLAQLPALLERVKELEARAHQNSRNSNTPPSADEFVKPKSRRTKSGKPAGGQKGHQGNTLPMTPLPDRIVTHRVMSCQGCGHSLEDVPLLGLEKRQEYDIPPLVMTVTEHRAENKRCPRCGCPTQAPFPPGVERPVQYGHQVQALLVYLNHYQLIPYRRTVELIRDVSGHPLSEGTLFHSLRSAYDSLQPVEEAMVTQLLHTPVNHVDETGMRVEARRQWLHVISTDTLTHYAHHPKRGTEALKHIGILPAYTGISVHDFWKPYMKLDCTHALCNAHHIRELTGIFDLTGQGWANEMIDLLLEIKGVVDQRKTFAPALEPAETIRFEQKYDRIVEKGYLENPPPADNGKKRGRKKQSKARNLLKRLKDHRRETLEFMYDFAVPFDNNLAERDLRMMKVKQKISGVFRSEEGAAMFCRIRGYISMARKNSIPVLGAIKDALDGHPFIPQV